MPMFSGSLVAIVTPMADDGAVDYAAWARLVDFHLTHGTQGLVVGGTTGESATLTEPELQQLVVRAREQIRGRMALLAGAGTSNTAQSVERAKWLSTLGVDGLLVVTPAYNKPTQEGLYQHFAAVAAASAVPVVLYNVPGRTAVDMLPATVARLAELPRIVAIKEAVERMERIRELVAIAPSHFAVLSGDDATAREAQLAGARGVISVTGEMAQMIAMAVAGRADEAARIDRRLAPWHRLLFVESNPIPVKWALARMGLIGPGIRLPLTPLAARHHSLMRTTLEEYGLLSAARTEVG
jgi:4-hydroxy-tetrahydrodipicolinate synthase